MIKSKYFYLLVMLFSIIICCSCNSEFSQKKLDEMSKEIKEDYTLPYMKSGGVSLGLFNLDGEIEVTQSFDIKKGESFKKIISVGNMIDKEREYKIILFDNYQQRSFIVNGSNTLEYDFKAKEYDQPLIPIEVSNFNEGFHDMFFVIIKYPHVKSLDKEFRMATDMNNLLFIRFNIIVEKDTQSTLYFDKSFKSSETVFDGVFLSKSNDKLLTWLTEKASKNSNVDFNIYVGNESYSEQQTFAVITLLNWTQVSFYNSNDVVFFSVDKGEKIMIPSSVTVPDEKGVYDLVSILVHNPYELLDIYNKDIETGIRVGIDVK